MLQRPPESPFPGPNGLEIYKDEVYVANSATGNIVAIAIEDNDDAGQARVHATLPDGQGCDEFVFDVHSSVYCTTDPLLPDTSGQSTAMFPSLLPHRWEPFFNQSFQNLYSRYLQQTIYGTA